MSNMQDIRAVLEAGLRHHRAGQLAEARRLYEQAVAMDARQADALHLLGVLAHQSGDNESAVELISRAISINPASAAFHSNLGNALLELGRPGDSVAAYEAALRLQPDYAEGHYNLGNALLAMSRFDAALAAYEAALRLKPDYAEAYSNRGNALMSLERLEDAAASFRAAIRVRPDYVPAHYKLGNALLAMSRFDAALAAYDSALRLRPGHADALANRGSALMSLGCPDEALAAYEAALHAAPDLASAHYNLGTAQMALSRIDAAVDSFNAAIRLQADHAKAHSNLIMCLHYQPEAGDADILRAARLFAAPFTPRPRGAFSNAAEPGRRLRVGYVSADFNRHTVGDYVSPVLPHHDPEAVEVFCYSNSNSNSNSNSRASDDVTDRLRRAADNWRSIAGLPDDAATAQIMEDGVDILIDLSGHTSGNRLALFGSRAAPVQATWLGFWGTTGLAGMDYILSDEDTIPPGQEAHYSERILRLPGSRFCYQPPDYAPSPVEPPALRTGYVTFGSFNNLNKINLRVILLWAQVLLAVPGSRLLLKWKTLGREPVRQQLLSRFAALGVAPDRLILRAGSPHPAMLAEYGDVDIALDPFPFSGGVTSCEALWMGVPVVTWPGTKAVSRQTAGFLRAIGRTEWVAGSADAYVRTAAILAADKAKLAAIRAGLRQEVAASALCGGKDFTRRLEGAYRKMWLEWCESAPAR